MYLLLFEIYPKGPYLECRLRWPSVCKNDLWWKSRLEFAKVNYVIVKVFAKDYVYMHTCIQCLVPMHVLQEGEDGDGNQNYIDFCSSHGIRTLGILSIFYFAINIGWLLAKVWRKFCYSAKVWRKRAFPWKLGGLHCVLVMSRVQEARWEERIVRARKCQNWPMKVSKDQHLKAKRKILSAAATEWSVTGVQMPGTNLRISHINVFLTSVGQHVPLKTGSQKFAERIVFVGEDVFFHVKEFRTAPDIYIYIYSLHKCFPILKKHAKTLMWAGFSGTALAPTSNPDFRSCCASCPLISTSNPLAGENLQVWKLNDPTKKIDKQI